MTPAIDRRLLLPSAAERGRTGLVMLMVACLVPLFGDVLQGRSRVVELAVIEFLRVLLIGGLAWFLRRPRDERVASFATLAGFAVMAITAARVGVLRGDIGPYAIVTVGLALSSSVGMPWEAAFQAAAAAILTGGLAMTVLWMPGGPPAGIEASVVAYMITMAASVFMSSLDTRRRHATGEALDRSSRAGEALRELNDHLEQRVKERAQALEQAYRELAATNTHLAAANRDLEAACRELEGFTHSVSHDLRVPLRVIHGLSRLALEECGEGLDRQGRDYLTRIGEEAIRLGEIGDDLLTLARVTRAAITTEDVDVSDLAREVVARLRRTEPHRSVDLRIHEGLRWRFDPNLLRILLEQLLANAWKFTRRCEPAMIEVGRAEEDGRSGFFVRDNGTGFPPELAGKLFGRFERIHDDEAIEGRGIGLTIAMRIVSRHGGRIRAEGEIGKGATFVVTLAPV